MSHPPTRQPRQTTAGMQQLRQFRHRQLLTLPAVITTPDGTSHLVPGSELTGQALYELPDGQQVPVATLLLASRRQQHPDPTSAEAARPQQLDMFTSLEELS